MGGKSQIIRDTRLRFSVEANEIKRRALLYIARNATLESQVRHRAQLQLHNMDGNTRPGRVSNRCMETGRGRGELMYSATKACSHLMLNGALTLLLPPSKVL
jgi:small subunit ribosomal protein S14